MAIDQRSTSSTRTFQSNTAKVQEPALAKPTKKPKLTSQNLPILLILILVIVLAVLFFLYHNEQLKLDSTGPRYNSLMLGRLSKLILLPTSSPSTIATIKDVTKINQLAFYKQAKDGDVLFVYNDAHEAILFRPSDNKIINVSTNIQATPSGGSLIK